MTEVNDLLHRFGQMRKMMKNMGQDEAKRWRVPMAPTLRNPQSTARPTVLTTDTSKILWSVASVFAAMAPSIARITMSSSPTSAARAMASSSSSIGNYDPKKPGDNANLDLSRIDYWISKGAQPSDTVRSFLKKARKKKAAAAK